MTLNELVTEHDRLGEAVNVAGEAIEAMCKDERGEMGLLNDTFKSTKEYKDIKAKFTKAWDEFSAFNHEHRKNRELSDFMHTRWMNRRMPAKEVK